jgi:PEP-CTERM motif
MLTSYQKVMVPLALGLVLFTVPASADPIVYVVNVAQQFGTVDLLTGSFTPIGPGTPDTVNGLAQGPNGSFLTLSVGGNLESIDGSTGAVIAVKPTGLGDCTNGSSPCGPNSANVVGGFNGVVYATDFNYDLYRVNAATAVAALIGPTGVPPITANPTIPNPDGTFTLFDGNLFGAGGSLYTTRDAFNIDFGTGISTPVLAPNLYRIDPSTGVAALIGPTEYLSALVEVNGTAYAFGGLNAQQIFSLNLTTGKTNFVSDLDPAAGVIVGAVQATPEPASLALAGIGIATIVVVRRRRRPFLERP